MAIDESISIVPATHSDNAVAMHVGMLHTIPCTNHHIHNVCAMWTVGFSSHTSNALHTYTPRCCLLGELHSELPDGRHPRERAPQGPRAGWVARGRHTHTLCFRGIRVQGSGLGLGQDMGIVSS